MVLELIANQSVEGSSASEFDPQLLRQKFKLEVVISFCYNYIFKAEFKMKKVVIKVSAGMAGTDHTYFYEVPEQVIGTEEFDDFCWQTGVDWAGSYGVYPEDADACFVDEDDERHFSSQYAGCIEGYYEIYVPEKHDGQRVGNDNSWQKY